MFSHISNQEKQIQELINKNNTLEEKINLLLITNANLSTTLKDENQRLKDENQRLKKIKEG